MGSKSVNRWIATEQNAVHQHCAQMPEQRFIIERAFVLARSGEYENVAAVMRQLQHEGYLDIQLHFSGRT
jgi:hypothetical protein